MGLARTATATVPIAVVIPTHNTRELTLRCLACLGQSSVQPQQVIVVDDGSSDRTSDAVAATHPDVRVLRNQRARGFSIAANRGLAEATSPVLLLLNSDTEVDPDCLASFWTAFSDQRELGIAGASLLNPDGSFQWSGGREPTKLWLFANSSGLGALIGSFVRLLRGQRPGTSKSVDWVAGAALAMRREVWEDCGPLDDRFEFYCQDLDFCLRAGRSGWEVQVLPECRVMHHLGATIGRDAGATQDTARLLARPGALGGQVARKGTRQEGRPGPGCWGAGASPWPGPRESCHRRQAPAEHPAQESRYRTGARSTAKHEK